MKNIKLLFILALVIAFTTISFAGKKMVPAPIPSSTSWVPADFDPKTQILLVKIERYIKPNGKDYYAKQNKQLEDVMQQYYPYKYELVENALGEKYKNKTLYPYMLTFGSHEHTYANQSAHSVSGTSGNTISLLDLRTGKFSETNGYATAYKKGILKTTILEMLEVYNKRSKK